MMMSEKDVVEALVALVMRCTRCGKRLKHVYELNGAPFGRVCVKKELMGE